MLLSQTSATNHLSGRTQPKLNVDADEVVVAQPIQQLWDMVPPFIAHKQHVYGCVSFSRRIPDDGLADV